MDNTEALRIARDAYAASTTYVDANFRKQWEDALRMFQSKHPVDSKYNSETYKFRSKLFRPKMRSVIRKNEAAAAAAFFSNLDVVNVAPTNTRSDKQVFSAKLYKELLQYRLTKSIPWFLTLIGGFQDAMTVGVVCSYQHWIYREAQARNRSQLMFDDTQMPVMGFEGGPMQFEESGKVLEDRPAIDLRPVENIRIDRGASWTDPVNSSPYLIDLVPMYLGDVKEMGRDNPKTGEPGWIIPEDSALQAATRQAYDSTRQVREGNREDSKEGNNPVTDFSIVWVHKNIVRKAGEDFCYWTLGTEHMLSRETQPLNEVYFHGERPYAMGCAIIETHKVYPSGFPEIGKDVVKEINEVTNSRLDNVRLVMNKRYLVKRGAQVDLKSLVRNVAASITLANDPTGDVKTIDFDDVTSSSYQEQDRLSIEADELLGNFSQSSVMTNRKLNETVGGMALLGQGANQLTEYSIRTFTETWLEPVLRQLAKLEKYYETDEKVLQVMGERLELAEGEQLTDDHFDTDVEITVNVGMGATDPIQRINRLLTAAKSIAEIAQMNVPGLKINEVSKEVFGAVGYRDGGRFWEEEEDPRVVQAVETMQNMENIIVDLQGQLKSKVGELTLKYETTKLQTDSKERQQAVDILSKVDELAAKIDLMQAQTLKTLKEGGVEPSTQLTVAAAALQDSMHSFVELADGIRNMMVGLEGVTNQVGSRVDQVGEMVRQIPSSIQLQAPPKAGPRRGSVKFPDGEVAEVNLE